jgi:hypothetical protein
MSLLLGKSVGGILLPDHGRTRRRGGILSDPPPTADPPAGHTPAPAPEFLLVDTPDAAALSGISRATFFQLRAAGKIGPASAREILLSLI